MLHFKDISDSNRRMVSRQSFCTFSIQWWKSYVAYFSTIEFGGLGLSVTFKVVGSNPSPNYNTNSNHLTISLIIALACVARSFSQVVLGLPLGLVPCRRPIIRSSVMPPFLTRWPWKASRLLSSPPRRVGFVLALLNTSSLVTCSVHEMRSILRWHHLSKTVLHWL